MIRRNHIRKDFEKVFVYKDDSSVLAKKNERL